MKRAKKLHDMFRSFSTVEYRGLTERYLEQQSCRKIRFFS